MGHTGAGGLKVGGVGGRGFGATFGCLCICLIFMLSMELILTYLTCVAIVHR